MCFLSTCIRFRLRRNGMFFLVLSVLLLPVITCKAYAASAPRVSPRQDDPQLYLIALHLIETIENTIHAEPNSAKRRSLTEALQRQLNLSDADVSKVVAAAHEADVTVRPHNPNDPNDLKRNQAISKIETELSSALSPQAWKNFRAFVNGPLRKATVVISQESMQP